MKRKLFRHDLSLLMARQCNPNEKMENASQSIIVSFLTYMCGARPIEFKTGLSKKGQVKGYCHNKSNEPTMACSRQRNNFPIEHVPLDAQAT